MTDTLKLYLTPYEMNADFGNTYCELKAEYPFWSKDLHEKGNILEEEKLQIIFCRGLLLWYIRHCIGKCGLNLFMHNKCQKYTFFETISLIKFFCEINKNIVDESLLNILKYDSYQSLMLTDKTKLCSSFKEYKLKHNIDCAIQKLINEKDKYNKIYEELCCNKSIESFIYEQLLLTPIVKIGIMFQRWKIVLEKMGDYMEDKDDTYMKKMYLVDKFLTNVQEMILLCVKIHVDLLKYTFMTNDIETYKINKINFNDMFQNSTYSLIYQNINSCDILINKIIDPENISDEYITLLKSFYKN